MNLLTLGVRPRHGSKPMSIDTYKYTAPKQSINWVDFILDYIQDGCLLNKYYLKKGENGPWEANIRTT
jgi:hypothetical protein